MVVDKPTPGFHPIELGSSPPDSSSNVLSNKDAPVRLRPNPNRSRIVRQRPVSANHAAVSVPIKLSPRKIPDKSSIGSKSYLAKQRIHMHVEVEAYTYGFDVSYGDYLSRYNKIWAAIELLDALQAYQLLRGLVRNAGRIAASTAAFDKVMNLMIGQERFYKLMKRRLDVMLQMIKVVLIQISSIEEILHDMGETYEKEYSNVFQAQIEKLQAVKLELDDVYQKAKSASIGKGSTQPDGTLSPKRRYNKPTLPLSMSQTIPVPREDAEEDEEKSESTSSDSVEYGSSTNE